MFKFLFGKKDNKNSKNKSVKNESTTSAKENSKQIRLLINDVFERPNADPFTIKEEARNNYAVIDVSILYNHYKEIDTNILKESIVLLSDLEKEQFFICSIIYDRILCDEIEDYYPIWIKAYQRAIKLIKGLMHFEHKANTYLLLFGFSSEYLIDKEQDFNDYKKYYQFLKNKKQEKNSHFGTDSQSIYYANSLIQHIDLKPVAIDPLCRERIYNIICANLKKESINSSNFVWVFYTTLFIENNIPTIENLSKKIEQRQIRDKNFARQLERTPLLIERKRETLKNRQEFNVWSVDKELTKQQLKEEASKIKLPQIVKEWGLSLTKPNWSISIQFTTANIDLLNFEEDYKPEFSAEDTVLTLYLSNSTPWLIDLQWLKYNDSELGLPALRNIQNDRRKRRRISWRHMTPHPISQLATKDSFPQITDINNFPSFLKELVSTCNIQLKNRAYVTANGIEEFDSSKLEKWLETFSVKIRKIENE